MLCHPVWIADWPSPSPRQHSATKKIEGIKEDSLPDICIHPHHPPIFPSGHMHTPHHPPIFISSILHLRFPGVDDMSDDEDDYTTGDVPDDSSGDDDDDVDNGGPNSGGGRAAISVQVSKPASKWRDLAKLVEVVDIMAITGGRPRGTPPIAIKVRYNVGLWHLRARGSRSLACDPQSLPSQNMFVLVHVHVPP